MSAEFYLTPRRQTDITELFDRYRPRPNICIVVKLRAIRAYKRMSVFAALK